MKEEETWCVDYLSGVPKQGRLSERVREPMIYQNHKYAILAEVHETKWVPPGGMQSQHCIG